MKLVSISIERYRSITKAYKIGLGNTTVLVGPNNEGKSNVIRALVAGMGVLTGHVEATTASRTGPRRLYDWDRDFPVGLRVKQPEGTSTVTLEFALTAEEVAAFKRATRSNLNGTLPLRATFGKGRPTLRVAKKGPGGPALSKKSAAIAKFVADRLQFEHIPAVRTAQTAQGIVEELVAKELAAVEDHPDYLTAIQQIESLQQPILDRLGRTIRDTLAAFLPDVEAVTLSIPRERRYRALRRSCSIVVDDGTPTPLRVKGDGVQSLAALAIMRHASATTASGRHLVLAIEEPESHLHPNAIHELRAVLDEMSNRQQVVVTTHNPLFVNRTTVSTNVLVHQNKARPAESLDEIRQVLGVRAADNLRGVDLVLVVEGEDDRIALRALLGARSAVLADGLAHGYLGIDVLGGASHLVYKLSLLRATLATYHCFLDDDDAGRRGFEQARQQGLVTDAEVHLAVVAGQDEAELEDIYDPDLYRAYVQHSFGVALTASTFRGRKKWSDRLHAAFAKHGKPWNDRVAADVKRGVARLASAQPEGAIHTARGQAFGALTAAIEERLAGIRAHPAG